MKNFQYILTHSSGNLTLENNPINWANINVEFVRSKRYHSVLRKSILNIELPFDGKVYIDAIFDTYGIDTDVGCEVKYLDKSDFTYTTMFDGIIDLSEWTATGDVTTVKIIDSVVLDKFTARDNTKISLDRTTDLDGDAISSYDFLSNVLFTGVEIEEKAEFILSTNEITITAPHVNESFTEYFGVSDSDYDFNTIGTDADLPDASVVGASGPLYTNNTASAVSVRFRIITSIVGDIDMTGAGVWSWGFDVFTGKNGATNSISESDNGVGPAPNSINESYDSGYLSVSLSPGETIEIYHAWSGTSDASSTITPDLTIAPIHFEIFVGEAPYPDTGVSTVMLHELGAMLLEIMTGEADPLNATLFGRTDSEPRTYGSDGDYSLTGVASGFMIRSFPHTFQPLTTTFRDYFKAIDSLYNLGMWYDGTEFIISNKVDFYEDVEIISLGEVTDLETTVSIDDYHNAIDCGYKEVSYEDVNGQQVPNVPVFFANALRRPNTLNLKPMYRADDYGIELTRAQQWATTSGEDTDADNDNFLVVTKRNGGSIETLPGSDFNLVSGIYSPSTRLNLDITPKRNLLRNSNLLSIPLYKSTDVLSFLSSQFNLDLSTQKGGGDPVISEIDDIASLDEPLYYPEVYNFTAKLTEAHIAQLNTDPHGYVTFEFRGVEHKGFIEEVSTEPFMRRGNWTLIKRNPNR